MSTPKTTPHILYPHHIVVEAPSQQHKCILKYLFMYPECLSCIMQVTIIQTILCPHTLRVKITYLFLSELIVTNLKIPVINVILYFKTITIQATLLVILDSRLQFCVLLQSFSTYIKHYIYKILLSITHTCAEFSRFSQQT